MDAVAAATERNAERDRLNALRLARIRQPEIAPPIMPVPQPLTGDGGNGPNFEDTRTDQQKYRDAIAVNKYAGAIPLMGTGIGLINDYYIDQYERENPNEIPSVQRYSTVGRILGFGDPGTTGLSGVFGSNSDLWNAGLFPMDGDSGNDSTGNVGARGDAYNVQHNISGMGPSWSGPQHDNSDNYSGPSDTYGGADAGTGDDDQWD